jgi:hypothetical protein
MRVLVTEINLSAKHGIHQTMIARGSVGPHRVWRRVAVVVDRQERGDGMRGTAPRASARRGRRSHPCYLEPLRQLPVVNELKSQDRLSHMA